MSIRKTLIIGTRGSDLALWQARRVAERLKGLNIDHRIEIISTSGDRFQDIALQKQQDKGFFTREIENRLISGDIDIAVHSLKDLPTASDSMLEIGAYLPRGPVGDLLIVHPDRFNSEESDIFPVAHGSKVGAGSLRRQALLNIYCPHAEPALLRGNVPTRIRKCREGQYDAIIIARAGVERLRVNLRSFRVSELNPEIWLPAPGQGVVAVQIRKEDKKISRAVAKINDPKTGQAAQIERQLLANFEGGCHSAFGAFAQSIGIHWRVTMGVELTENEWKQSIITGTPEYCGQFGINNPPPLNQPIKVTRRERLCRPYLS